MPLPLKLFRLTETLPDPFCEIVIDGGLAVNEHGATVGVGVGLGKGVGVGVGAGVGVGVGAGVGVGVGSGVGVGVAFGSGVGVGDGLTSGKGSGVDPGVGDASGMTVPPVPFRGGAGMEPSAKISRFMVTSPEPEIFTLLEKSIPAIWLLNPTLTSVGIRPRQSKLNELPGILIDTPDSVEKFCVLRTPVPLKSIVTA